MPITEGPLVSVIIPTYNRPIMVRNAIESVLAQTYQSFEMIVVDSSESPETRDLASSYHDPRIRYLFEPRVSGVFMPSRAKNAGIKASKGEFIAFLDDDDTWYPLKLEKQIPAFNDPTVGVVYCLYETVKDGKVIPRKKPTWSGHIYKKMLEGHFVPPSTAVVRKKCFDAVGLFDESHEYCEDWEMWIWLSERYLFHYVPQLLVTYNMHYSSADETSNVTNWRRSGKLMRVLESRIRMMEAQKDYSKKVLGLHYHRLAVEYSRRGDDKKACELERKAVGIHPTIRSLAAYCLLTTVHWYPGEKIEA